MRVRGSGSWMRDKTAPPRIETQTLATSSNQKRGRAKVPPKKRRERTHNTRHKRLFGQQTEVSSISLEDTQAAASAMSSPSPVEANYGATDLEDNSSEYHSHHQNAFGGWEFTRPVINAAAFFESGYDTYNVDGGDDGTVTSEYWSSSSSSLDFSSASDDDSDTENDIVKRVDKEQDHIEVVRCQKRNNAWKRLAKVTFATMLLVLVVRGGREEGSVGRTRRGKNKRKEQNNVDEKFQYIWNGVPLQLLKSELPKEFVALLESGVPLYNTTKVLPYVDTRLSTNH